ncbi:MAG: hypothetical protein GY737_23650 [Desulfobacteraceae bacterium]|nr:hypothetical protein [Desulfobacteraceae bacterium]
MIQQQQNHQINGLINDACTLTLQHQQQQQNHQITASPTPTKSSINYNENNLRNHGLFWKSWFVLESWFVLDHTCF